MAGQAEQNVSADVKVTKTIFEVTFTAGSDEELTRKIVEFIKASASCLKGWVSCNACYCVVSTEDLPYHAKNCDAAKLRR